MENMPHISASQIESYLMCPRKWGFRSIEKVQAPPNKYAQRGLDLHDVAERFLRDGTEPPDTDAGKAFRAGLPFLPAPGTGVCEGAFEYRIPGEPFVFVGRIDWRRGPKPFAIDLLDHKTTSSSDFSWTKDKGALMADVQAMLYSAYVMQLEGLEVIRGRWLSYRWTPDRPKAVPVDFEAPLAHVVAQFEKIREIAREMAFRVEQHVKAAELPYDAASCGAFGGCPYHDKCALSGAERLRAHMSPQLSLKEKMAMRAQQQPAVNPPPAAAPAAPAPAVPAQAVLPAAVAAPAAPASPAAVAAPAAPASPAASAAPAMSLADKMKARRAAAPAAPAPAAPEAAATAAPSAAPAAPASVAPATLTERMAAKKAAMPAAPAEEAKAAAIYLSKEKCDDLALGCEMIAAGLKAIAQHFRSLA